MSAVKVQRGAKLAGLLGLGVRVGVVELLAVGVGEVEIVGVLLMLGVGVVLVVGELEIVGVVLIEGLLLGVGVPMLPKRLTTKVSGAQSVVAP